MGSMTSDPLADQIDRLRGDTPGTAHVTHLNNAGAGLAPAVVTDTVIEHLRLESQIGGYEAQAAAEARISATRDSIGRLLGTSGSSIAFAESATAAWDRALQALLNSGQLHHGKEVLVASSEYASNVLPLIQLQRSHGIGLRFVPDGPDGALDVEALAHMLTERTALVALTHAPSQNGLINDLPAVGNALRHANSPAWFLVDACQTAGQIPLDMNELGCDFLSATGRKFLRGPRGTGFLALSQRALTTLEPFPLDLNSASWSATGEGGERFTMVDTATRFESWERSYAGFLGLGAAVDYALDLTIPAIETRITTVAEYARAQLAEIPGVIVRDRGSRRSGIVTFTREAHDPLQIIAALRAAHINVSYSPAEVALRDFVTHDVTGVVRVSPHVFTTDDEIERLVSIVAAN